MAGALTGDGEDRSLSPNPVIVSAGLSLSAAYDQADAIRASVDREQILQRETNERDQDRAKAEADRVTCMVTDADLALAGERNDLDRSTPRR